MFRLITTYSAAFKFLFRTSGVVDLLVVVDVVHEGGDLEVPVIEVPKVTELPAA